MKICIVSTYPEKGSRNIGDALITDQTIRCISDVYGKGNVSFTVVFRADYWSDVKSEVLSSDFVVFACLAIRRNIERTTYPYIEEILRSGIPYGVLAAGTSLDPDARNLDEAGRFGDSTVDVLRRLDAAARFFTTRGSLTQGLCEAHGLKNARMCGDIAFNGAELWGHKPFRRVGGIRRLGISDPHDFGFFADAFDCLLRQTKKHFPDAEIDVLQHGENPGVIEAAGKFSGITVREVHKGESEGLDAYDEIDLHIGFRVHGHVSALKRGKYSYLLEQDGRGQDYGLTLLPRISVACYAEDVLSTSPKAWARWFLTFGKRKPVVRRVGTYGVEQIFAMIRTDRDNGFEKFDGLEKQIKRFEQENRNTVALIDSGSCTV